jgi:hypothetical protein
MPWMKKGIRSLTDLMEKVIFETTRGVKATSGAVDKTFLITFASPSWEAFIPSKGFAYVFARWRAFAITFPAGMTLLYHKQCLLRERKVSLTL